MKLLDTKSVKVGKLEFYVRLTNRAVIGYETLTGRNFWVDFGGDELNNEKLTQLFYTTAKAGARQKGITFEYTYEEFLDITDDYPEAAAFFYQAIKDPDEEGEVEKKKK